MRCGVEPAYKPPRCFDDIDDVLSPENTANKSASTIQQSLQVTFTFIAHTICARATNGWLSLCNIVTIAIVMLHDVTDWCFKMMQPYNGVSLNDGVMFIWSYKRKLLF